MDSSINKVVGNRVKHFRKKRGLSQTQLSEIVGLTRSSISNIESGRQSTKLEKYYHIAEILKIDIYDLLPSINKIDTDSVSQNIELSVEKDKYPTEVIDWITDIISKENSK